LHGIKSDIKGILSWMKKEPKKDVFMITLKATEVKVQVEGNFLTEEIL
jgi:hypothetical protein